jgi:hypothetical protein
MPPTRQYGVESKVAWLDAIRDLPAQRIDEWLRDKGAHLVNNQRSE